jgi:hypothetical protein
MPAGADDYRGAIMNLTVGPLPPAVYWRRRAIVLGGLLLVILLVTYACSGPGKSNASGQRSVTPPATALTPSDQPSLAPSTMPSTSAVGTASAAVSLTPSGLASPSASGGDTIATCTDAQIKVTPVISSTSSTTQRLEVGGTYDLKLKIRNVSAETCRRDVGGVPEELLVTRGSTKIWSSDDCQHAKAAHDIRTFGPGIEIYADVKWNSYNVTTSTCKKGKSPTPAGKYVLTGRVGTKKANVSFKIG